MNRLRQVAILYLLICILITLFLTKQPDGTTHLLHPRVVKEECTCNNLHPGPLLQKTGLIDCIGPSENKKAVDTRGWSQQQTCSRTFVNFMTALNGENVPWVPQSGTFLRWYRDCEMFTADDHDIDIGIFAQDFHRIDWRRLFDRVAWLHLLQGDLYTAYYFATDWVSIERLLINGVDSPLKVFINSAGGIPQCDIDVWFMYHHPKTHINWRCMPDWGRALFYGPVESYQKILLQGISGGYVPANTEQCVKQTFGSTWQQKIGYDDWQTIEGEKNESVIIRDTDLNASNLGSHFVPPTTLRDECVSLIQEFEGINSEYAPCTCYNLRTSVWSFTAKVRNIILSLWFFGVVVPCCVGFVMWMLFKCVKKDCFNVRKILHLNKCQVDSKAGDRRGATADVLSAKKKYEQCIIIDD